MLIKKTILLFIVFLCIVASVNAQRYSINKYNFDSRNYVPKTGDVNNPAICGVCSFFIPGLGQVVSGETGRGIAFFGGYIGCLVIAEAGGIQIMSNLASNRYYRTGNPNEGVGTLLLGLGGMAFVEIWSIVDAVKVAKVNNMYYRSLRNTSSLKLEVSPYAEQLSINNQITTPVGMTMRVKF